MASARQVTDYLMDCVLGHLEPDALGVRKLDDACLILVTRKPGTVATRGERFAILVIPMDREVSDGPPAG